MSCRLIFIGWLVHIVECRTMLWYVKLFPNSLARNIRQKICCLKGLIEIRKYRMLRMDEWIKVRMEEEMSLVRLVWEDVLKTGRSYSVWEFCLGHVAVPDCTYSEMWERYAPDWLESGGGEDEWMRDGMRLENKWIRVLLSSKDVIVGKEMQTTINVATWDRILTNQSVLHS